MTKAKADTDSWDDILELCCRTVPLRKKRSEDIGETFGIFNLNDTIQ